MADDENSAEKENQNPSKKRRLSLSLKRMSKPDVFVEASSEDLQSMSIYRMPENSARSSRWALNNVISWFDEYNKRKEDDKCPEEILTPSCSKEILNKWLCIYILRLAGATSAGVPERVIQGRTGHVSLEALRKYAERITESREAAVFKILTGEKDVLDDTENKVFKPSVTDSSSSTTGMTGSHYNNCTINVYQQPNYMPPSNYMHPPFQPPSMMYDYNMPDLGLLDYYNDTKKD